MDVEFQIRMFSVMFFLIKNKKWRLNKDTIVKNHSGQNRQKSTQNTVPFCQKIHSYRLLFQRFCSLGSGFFEEKKLCS